MWNEQIPTKLYLSKLFQEEIECLNSSITIKVTKPIANKISSSPPPAWKKSPGSDGFTDDSQCFKEQNVSLIQIFLENRKRGSATQWILWDQYNLYI